MRRNGFNSIIFANSLTMMGGLMWMIFLSPITSTEFPRLPRRLRISTSSVTSSGSTTIAGFGALANSAAAAAAAAMASAFRLAALIPESVAPGSSVPR